MRRAVRFIFPVWFVFVLFPVFSQNVEVVGYVFGPDGKRLSYVQVYLDGHYVCESDSEGLFRTRTEAGKHVIKLSHPGYFDKTEQITVSNDTTIAIILRSKNVEVEQVVVKGRVFEPTYDKINLNLELVGKIPGLTGETDLIKLMQLLPCVQMGTEGSTGLNVRGGDNSQNLFLIDGVEMYKLSHVFNFMSSVNPFIIRQLDFYKGGFPGYYGDRLSSVVDIKLMQPVTDSSFVKLNTGVLETNLLYNFRINDKNAFYIAARATYIDKIAQGLLWGYKKMFAKYLLGESLPVFSAGFYDTYLKASHYFRNQKGMISLLLYSSKDVYASGSQVYSAENQYVLDKGGISWGENFASLRYSRDWQNSSIKIQSSFQKYFMEFSSLTQRQTKDTLTTTSEAFISLARKFNFNVLYKKTTSHHNLVLSGSYNMQSFENTVKDSVGTAMLSFSPLSLVALSVTDKIRAGSFRIMPVLRLNTYLMNDSVFYSIVPRFSVSYILPGAGYIRLSYDVTNQSFLEFTTYSSFLPYQMIHPVENSSQLSIARQYSAEFYYNFFAASFSFSLFYKDLQRLADIKFYGENAVFIHNNIDYNGRGKAYGMEVFVQKSFEKLNLQSSLTLSRAFRKYDFINNGNTYPFRYDRPVNFNILVDYQINSKWSVSVFWTYMSGFNLTMPVARFWNTEDVQDGLEGYYFASRNNYRTPAYHRLDISFNYAKPKEKYKIKWILGLYNAYNRLNVYNVVLSDESPFMRFPAMSRLRMSRITLYPIMPIVGFRIEWY